MVKAANKTLNKVGGSKYGVHFMTALSTLITTALVLQLDRTIHVLPRFFS